MNTEITSDDKLWAALSYITMYIPFAIPVGAIVALILEPQRNRPFIKTHAMQALAAWGVTAVLSLVAVGVCLLPFVFIASFYWAYKAFQGEEITIPLLTDFLKKQNWI
jgi:uncharacterized membrane protein